MNKWLISGMVLLIIIIFGGLVIFNKDDAAAPDLPKSQEAVEKPTDDSGNQEAQITYGDSGFEPTSLTVKVNEQVSVVNNSSKTLQFDSDPHPEHTDNPELNVETVEPNQTKTFSVSKTGIFGVHNHLNPSERMTLTVE